MEFGKVGLFIGFALLCVVFVCSIKLRKNAFVKVECWFCGFKFDTLSKNANQFYCPKCEQYNGFLSDGSYNKEINEMYYEALNNKPSNTYTHANHTPNNKNPNLCNICAHNQQLLVMELAKWDGRDEKEAEEYEKRIQFKYRLCPHCKLLVEEHLKCVRKGVIARTIGGKSISIPNIPILSKHSHAQVITPILAILCRSMIHLSSFSLFLPPLFKAFQHTLPPSLIWIQSNWVSFSVIVVVFKLLLIIFDKPNKTGSFSMVLLSFASFFEIAVHFPEFSFVRYLILYKDFLMTITYSLIILYEIPPYTFTPQFKMFTNRSLRYTPPSTHKQTNTHPNENDSPLHYSTQHTQELPPPQSQDQNHTNHFNNFNINNTINNATQSSPIHSNSTNINNTHHQNDSPVRNPHTPNRTTHFTQTITHSPQTSKTPTAATTTRLRNNRLSPNNDSSEDSLGFESLIASIQLSPEAHSKVQTPWWKKWFAWHKNVKESKSK